MYPGMQFPQSSEAIIVNASNMESILNSRRPTVIEERRKSL